MTYWSEADAAMLCEFRWGVSDCAAALAAFRAVHHLDLMAEFRGRYGTALAAFRIIRNGGGLLELARDVAHRHDLMPCGAEPGAFGVSVPGVARGLDGRALLFCPERDVWVGKTASGYYAGLPAAAGWTCKL